MVIFVDLEDLESLSVAEERVPTSSPDWHPRVPHNDKSLPCPQMEDFGAKARVEELGELQETPNRGNFSAALASYP
jgi:hypothetical protein